MYLDSAIIVKLLVGEPDTALFVQALVGHTLSSSELAAPEVLSALLGKERKKLITKSQRLAAWRALRYGVPVKMPAVLRARRRLAALRGSVWP